MNLSAEYVDHNNDDLTVVNAARVSFDKKSETITDGDVKLIHYLANHNHWTPFAHSRFTFIGAFGVLKSVPNETELRQGLVFDFGFQKVRHSFFGWVQLLKAGYVNPIYEASLINQLILKMPVSSEAYGFSGFRETQSEIHIPETEIDERFIDHTLRETVPIFVARQRFKHTVDIDYNEVSRRYVSDKPDFYWPEVWRGAPTNGAKQGSSEIEITEMTMGDYGENYTDEPGAIYSAFIEQCEMFYTSMINSGIAPEQARMVLPQSMMTSYHVTGSLISWRRSFGLRIDAHAQKEIRDLAVMWGEVVPGVAS